MSWKISTRAICRSLAGKPRPAGRGRMDTTFMGCGALVWVGRSFAKISQ
jgi:hypothetical protein